MPSPKIEDLINNPIARLAVTVIGFSFTLGVIYSGFNTRLNEMPKEIARAIVDEMYGINKKVDEHILSERYELEALKKSTDFNTREIEKLKEALKPENIEIQTKKYRR